VLPAVELRQWLLTMPFAWRKRLGYDGRLVSWLTRLFVLVLVPSSLVQIQWGFGIRGRNGALSD